MSPGFTREPAGTSFVNTREKSPPGPEPPPPPIPPPPFRPTLPRLPCIRGPIIDADRSAATTPAMRMVEFRSPMVTGIVRTTAICAGALAADLLCQYHA